MSLYNIKIGKGESKNLIFKITTNAFIGTDKLLFALKEYADSKIFIYTKVQQISDLEIETVEDVSKYIFVVPFSTELSRSLRLQAYYYDLTLIDQYGEEKPLIAPTRLEIVSTIGASLEKAGV